MHACMVSNPNVHHVQATSNEVILVFWEWQWKAGMLVILSERVETQYFWPIWLLIQILWNTWILFFIRASLPFCDSALSMFSTSSQRLFIIGQRRKLFFSTQDIAKHLGNLIYEHLMCSLSCPNCKGAHQNHKERGEKRERKKRKEDLKRLHEPLHNSLGYPILKNTRKELAQSTYFLATVATSRLGMWHA